MIDIQNKSMCCGCSACKNVCPKTCIEMQRDNEGFEYPYVNREKCVDCGLCTKICPILNEKSTSNTQDTKVYAAYNKDNEIRKISSSGGVFSLIADYILREKGGVCGAAFCDEFRGLTHTFIESRQELGKLYGSKYFQSEIGNTYCETKKLLELGKKVLYTGTPCQIEGLHSFLQKEYDNLICMDVVCHGVPSKKLWNEYILFREKEVDSSLTEISFRNKENGWKMYDIYMKFANGREYRKRFIDDLFMRAFLQNVALRPSCYSCKFKKKVSQSDITIGDLWGCEKIKPEMDDNKGTSLVLIRTQKGKDIFSEIEKDLKYEVVDFERAVQHNPAILYSSPQHVNRKIFMEKLDSLPFDVLVHKYAVPERTIKSYIASLLQKMGILYKVKKILRRDR